MKKQFKQTYLSPETETLVVQTEATLMAKASGPGSGYNNNGLPGIILTEDDDYDYSF